MDDFFHLLHLYGTCVISWWWLTTALLSGLAFLAFMFKDADTTLSKRQALLCAGIGLLIIIPYLNKKLPLIVQEQFRARWKSLDCVPVRTFIVTTFGICLLIAPLAALVMIVTRFFPDLLDDDFDDTTSQT